jgi:hypothetical protein
VERNEPLEARILAFFGESIDWSDPEQALDTAGAALRELAADQALLWEAVDGLDAGRLEPGLGAGGAYWFELAKSDSQRPSVWLRYCPSGCVAPEHTHSSEVLALVLSGTYKQKLIGRGGGVGSPKDPINLFVRHERAGQVFALSPRQAHETSSTAGSVILAVIPPQAVIRDAAAASADSELRSKAELALRRLRRSAGDLFQS